jgi:3-oxoacyl-[acyl-carrier-protein] synthase-3
MSSRVKIIGTGSCLPEKILTNQDFEKIVDTTDEWIFSRTGMRERRIAGAEEFTSDMGARAAKKALEAAQISPQEVDLILCATLTPDYPFPSTACLIQALIGAGGCVALDVQAACTGYLYALAIAKAMVESGGYRNVLIVASEKLSSITDYTDRGTCVLFGDGAAACVVGRSEKPGLVIRDVSLGADGEQAQLLILPAGGSRRPASQETVQEKLHFIKMEGKEVFKHAVRRMEAAAKHSLDKAGVKEEEIRWLVPHQANIRIIETLAKRFSVPWERVFMTLHKYGNTSASSVGIALDELLHDHPLQRGENLLLVAFGAGLTWGASVLSYE